MTFPIFSQLLITFVSFIFPILLIDNSSLRKSVDWSLKANNKTFIFLAINVISIFKFKGLKRNDNFIDLCSIEIFEDRRSHQSPFLCVVEDEIADGRTQSCFNVMSAYHWAHSFANSSGCSWASHVRLNRCLSEYLSCVKLDIFFSFYWDAHMTIANDIHRLGIISNSEDCFPWIEH